MSYSIAKALSFPLGMNTLDHARKNKFVFNYTSVTNRAESIVGGSLITSSSLNLEFVVTYTSFHKSFPLVEFLVKSR